MIAAWLVAHGERAARTAGQVLGVLGILAFIAALSVCSSGCGLTPAQAARHGLASTARLGAQIDRDLAAERIRRSEAIIARPEATRAEHDAAMAPFDEALAITTDVRDAHLAAEAALDAAEHGAAEAWRPLMSCVLAGLSSLVGIAARHVALPDAVGETLQLLAGLAGGACPAPSGGER